MKQGTLVFMILLLATAYSYASSNPAEEAEHWEKVRQLDQLAERFKAETGFTGNVNYYYARMKLQSYEGKFADIPFSADADTTAFRQACTSILDKILPYTLATRSQLSMNRISRQDGYTRTEYYQLVNGYRVEGLGFIVITYDAGRYRFSIGDNTVELPDEVTSNVISRSEAEQIALKDKNDEHYNISKVYNLFYSTEGSESYYLAYLVLVSSGIDENYVEHAYWIDAFTGCVKNTYIAPIYKSDVGVSVKGAFFSPTVDLNNINTQCDTLGIPNARVWIANSSAQTDNTGLAIISNVLFSSPKVRLANMHFWMSVRTNSDTLETNSLILDQIIPDLYHVQFPDSGNGVSHYSSNSYIEALTHIGFLETHKPDCFGDSINIATACLITASGTYNPLSRNIKLKDARVHNTVRHELSHHFVHRVVGEMMSGTSQDAMDEGFANYFAGASKNDPFVPMLGGALDLGLNVHIPSSSTTDEDSYNDYDFGIPLASAWWSLRSNNTDFPSHGLKDGVDTLLVSGLNKVKDDLIENVSYRYKPRYFYNILMGNVDTDNIPWPLNAKQAAIDSVYSERGFLFYPKVRSVASASFDEPTNRGTYTLLDSVYVHVKNCPQNTKVKVSVVHDQGYGSVGVTGITIPSAVDVEGNLVCTDAWTDSTGVWAGAIPFSNMLPQGNYDIIVDVGSPNAPDNTLHLVFANDNIIDGVDGLNGSGFTKIGFGDMAVALDLSSSMQTYNIQLAQTVKALEESMIDGERINVFGFTEGTASENWLENGIVDLIGDETRFMEASEIDSTDINSKIEGKKIR